MEPRSEPKSEPKIELRIEKKIERQAPVSRVWRALTDYREFGEWFRVQLNSPFVAGEVTRGQITFPGFEHARFEAVVQKLEPETLFSYTWHPYSVDPAVDYSNEPSTLVEFRLEKIAGGNAVARHGIGIRQTSKPPLPGSVPHE